LIAGAKLNALRNDFLEKICVLKLEEKGLEELYNEKKKRYESVKAYSNISTLEVSASCRIYSGRIVLNIFSILFIILFKNI